MQINISTSEETEEILGRLSQRFNLPSKNILMRIAFSYSLTRGRRLNPAKPEDTKGNPYKEITVVGRYRSYYIALICQFYNIFKTDSDIPKYFKLHIDDGLRLLDKLFAESSNYNLTDFLLEHIERGIDSLEQSVTTNEPILFDERIRHLKINDKGYFGGALKMLVGKDLKTESPIYTTINDTTLHNNAHIAVAGNSGTGKTQFALEILRQFVTVSEGAVNFIYLDFKGLKKEDVNDLMPFFDKTKTTFIDAPQVPFPLNPMSFIDNVNEKNKIMGINKLVDIITHYSGIGKNQQQTLRDAIKDVFQGLKGGKYPSFKDIYERVIEMEGTKASTLREILESLSELDLFETAIDSKKSMFNQNYYLSLSGDLPNAVRFTSVFLIINYIYNNFMNMENAPVNDKIQGIRYVLLIDEAHVIFKDKKSQDLLEKILREIRSKGVSVILLSQGIEEFNQQSFDFSSMCETAFLMDIKDKTNLKMMSKFLGFGEKENTILARSMEQIQKGQAITNLKEFKKGELFEVGQFWKSL
ncbi:DndE family protein [Emticicia sp. W12TSBA100-4]|uniref:DndE family protein n=1 Tax=Emticicia sp. W12TSBA100-4 TaxID=3160965 RepID=UPI0033066EED